MILAGIRATLLITVLLAAFPASSFAQSADPFLFQSAFMAFDTGDWPTSVAIGDLNGDGRPDVVTTNVNSEDVSVLLGHGDGTFVAHIQFSCGNSPRSVAIGDLNADGRPDLAVANQTNTVSVLLGNGDGSFATYAQFGTGVNPLFVAIGDLNGDGRPDLAVANSSSDNVSVLLGNGDGTFATHTLFGTGGAPQSVAIGDLNSDGRPDLAAATTSSNTVSVLLGNGDGSFATATQFGTGINPLFVAIGDLNGDSRPDLAVANNSSNFVSVLLGNGDGTFSPQTQFGTGTYPSSLAIGDLNEDGRRDLAATNTGSHTVSVLIGNGDGTFGPHAQFRTGTAPLSVGVGDLDGDGHADLTVACSGSSTVSVLLGHGDGTLGSGLEFTTGAEPRSVAIGDLNGDGRPDLAVANWSSNTVSVLLGNGDGTFATHTQFGAGSGTVYSVAIGDLNGDGRLDIAVSNWGPGNVSVLLGNGDGTFAAQGQFGAGTGTSVAIGDLNQDGRPDLAVANYHANTVSVLLGNGDGSFAAQTEFGTGSTPHSVAIGDLNGDGRPDLAVANTLSAPPTVSVLIGNGDGTFATHTQFGTGSGPISVAIGDLNGDGRPDLAVATNDSKAVSVLLGNGDGTFATHAQFSTGSNPYSVAIGDLNGDGRPDLAAANESSNTVSVLLGNDDGTFATHTQFGSGFGPASVAIGDLNADGRPDLAVANHNANSLPYTVSVHLNLGATSSAPGSWSEIIPVGTPPTDRFGHSAIYDPVRDRMVVAGGGGVVVNEAWTLSLADVPAWTNLNPAGGWPGRNSHTAIYDPLRDRMVVFGGYYGASTNDVWALSLSGSPAWTNLSSTGTPPSQRSGHAAIYDPVRDRMVVFGGGDFGFGGAYNDVWALSLSGGLAWTQLTPTGMPPSARQEISAIYDPVRDRMVVFGGGDTDVWSLSLSGSPAWTQLFPDGTPPSARIRHSAIYDPVRDRMVVFAGYDGNLYNDVWALSLSGSPAWSQIVPVGSPPLGRLGHSAIYDPVRDRMVVFAGFYANPDLSFNDVWALTWGTPGPNRPPVCNPGGPYTVTCQGPHTSIQLDGRGSTDPDPGDVLTYLWTSDCPGASFDNPTSPTPTLRLNALSSTEILCGVTLVVSDGRPAGTSPCGATVIIPAGPVAGTLTGAPPTGNTPGAFEGLNVSLTRCGLRDIYLTVTSGGTFEIQRTYVSGDRVISHLGNEVYKVRRYGEALPAECEQLGTLCQGQDRTPQSGNPYNFTWPADDAQQGLYWTQKMAREYWATRLDPPHPLARAAVLTVGNPTLNNPASANACFLGGSDCFHLNFKPGISRNQDAVYHEFSHGMVIQIMQGEAISEGDSRPNTESRALDEGLADYFTAAATGDPTIGEGVLGSGRRSLENPNATHEYCNGAYRDQDAYDLAQALSGALWTLRRMLNQSPHSISYDRIDAWIYEAVGGLKGMLVGQRTLLAFRNLLRDLPLQSDVYTGEVDAAFASRNISDSPTEHCPFHVAIVNVVQRVLESGVEVAVSWTKHSAAATYALMRHAFNRSGMPFAAGEVVADGLVDTTYTYVEPDTTQFYAYVVVPVDSAGFALPTSEETPAVTAVGPVSIKNRDVALAAWPNPTRGAVDFTATGLSRGDVTITILDVSGRHVRSWKAHPDAGSVKLRWDGRVASGREASSGIYLVSLVQGSRRAVTRFVLVR